MLPSRASRLRRRCLERTDWVCALADL